MQERTNANRQARPSGLLSIVIPANNEAETIDSAVRVISEELDNARIPFELIFIDDGSKDATWPAISRNASENSRVRGVRFSRNFGKEAAILAGLAAARGDCCVVMDCDLQHPPATLKEMYGFWLQGYDIIEGVKSSRGKESLAHRLCAGTFYKLMSKALGFDVSASSDFKLLDRRVVDVITSMSERNTFFRALSYWTGYKTIEVAYDVQERAAGTSSWSTMSLARYAMRDLSAFTTAPMQLVTAFGVLMLILAVVQGLEALIMWFCGNAASGFTTVIILLLFTGSIIMISLGLIGFYIARIYEEVKNRPRYLVDETCGD